MGCFQGPETGNYAEWLGLTLGHGAESMCLSRLNLWVAYALWLPGPGVGVEAAILETNGQETEGRWFLEGGFCPGLGLC